MKQMIPLLLQTACVSHSCFVASTLISLENGESKKIEDIRIGDKIISYNLEHQSIVTRRVEYIFRSTTSTIYSITTPDCKIEGVTADHPFYSPKHNSWVKVGDLEAGDEVLFYQNGQLKNISISEVSSTELEDPVTVYNLTVEGSEHNYFANGILVHNKDTGEPMIGIYFIHSETGIIEGEIEEGTHDFVAHLYGEYLSSDEEEVSITWSKSNSAGNIMDIEDCTEIVNLIEEEYDSTCSIPLELEDQTVSVYVSSIDYGLDDDASLQFSVISRESEDSGSGE